MRPRLAVLVALGSLACRGAPQAVTPQSPQQALTQFLAAVRDNDLKRMGTLWGSERGPAAAWMKSDDLQRRLTIFQIYLNHAGYRVIDGPKPAPGQETVQRFNIELQRANGCNVVFPIDLGRARSGAWLVWAVDLATVGNPARGCRPEGTGTRP